MPGKRFRLGRLLQSPALPGPCRGQSWQGCLGDHGPTVPCTPAASGSLLRPEDQEMRHPHCKPSPWALSGHQGNEDNTMLVTLPPLWDTIWPGLLEGQGRNHSIPVPCASACTVQSQPHCTHGREQQEPEKLCWNLGVHSPRDSVTSPDPGGAYLCCSFSEQDECGAGDVLGAEHLPHVHPKKGK